MRVASGSWRAPVAVACGTALALVPFGISAIPRSTELDRQRFCPSGSCSYDALAVLPLVVVPVGLGALVIGALLCVHAPWRSAGTWAVRYATGLLAIGAATLAPLLLRF